MSRAASSSPPDGVAALDALARALLSAAPERVEPVGGPDELDAVLRLRHDHVVAHGWAPGTSFPDGLERDEYDARSVSIAAWAGSDLAGAIRIVLPAPGRRLPTEDAFDLDIDPRGAVVEIGRLLIAPALRGDTAHRTWGALFARTWVEVRARGHRVLAGAASPKLIEVYRSQGLPVEVLGPARDHWGQSRHPIRLDPAASARPGWFEVAPAP